MNKIKNVSLFCRIIFQILFILLPALLVINWIYAPGPTEFLGGIIRLDPIPPVYRSGLLHVLSTNEKILGFLADAVLIGLEMFMLYNLIRLFRRYEKNEIFSLNNVRNIRNIGYALLLEQLLLPFHEFVMGLVLTFHNPPHHRFAASSLDQGVSQFHCFFLPDHMVFSH